jgi:hypothetical protein
VADLVDVRHKTRTYSSFRVDAALTSGQPPGDLAPAP